LPWRIGRPNKFGVPPAYFDADIEPLVEEYAALFKIMQAPPANAKSSDTISLGLFFAEPTASRTSATPAPTHTRGACRQGSPRTTRAGGDGRR
jgi:hypothetical protein